MFGVDFFSKKQPLKIERLSGSEFGGIVGLLIQGGVVWKKKWREGVPTTRGVVPHPVVFSSSFFVVWYSTVSVILGVVRKVMLQDFLALCGLHLVTLW